MGGRPSKFTFEGGHASLGPTFATPMLGKCYYGGTKVKVAAATLSRDTWQRFNPFLSETSPLAGKIVCR